MADAHVQVVIHTNPRIITEYNAMSDAWYITVMCCTHKRLVAVTQEFIIKSLGTPEAITWELFKLLDEFIIEHQPLRKLILQLTHGSMEQSLDAEHIGFGGNKYAYSGVNLKWIPNNGTFAMTDAERSFWQNRMNTLGKTPQEQQQFFSAKTVTYLDGYPDDYDYGSGLPENFVSGGAVNTHSMSVGRDPRVDQLPGVHETVKHPVYKETVRITTSKTKTGVTATTKKYWTLESAIIDLNDNHDWTREQIADWIETLDIDTRFRGEDSDGHSRPQGAGVV